MIEKFLVNFLTYSGHISKQVLLPPELEPEESYVSGVEPLVLGHHLLQGLLVVGEAGERGQQPGVVDVPLDKVELVQRAAARSALAQLIPPLQKLL